jgi:hypothetical protein
MEHPGRRRWKFIFGRVVYTNSSNLEGMRTPFGEIRFPATLPQYQLEAILRALSWSNEMVHHHCHWKKAMGETGDMGVALHRDLNGHSLTVYPLLAAKLDAGIYVREVDLNHLPVWVDGNKVCIVGQKGRGHDLHTDLVATLILLVGQDEPNPKDMPRTLARALFPEISFTSGLERRARFARVTRQNEISEAFNAAMSYDVADPALYVDALPREDWQILRDRYPWDEEPETALTIADWMGGQIDRPVNDHVWAMSIYRAHAPGEYERLMLPALLHFEHPEVRAQALRDYVPEDAEMAWEHIGACLDDEVETIARHAHEVLQTYPALESRLVERSRLLMEALGEGRFHRFLVGWLSHHQDMDEELQAMLPGLEPHELGTFMRDIRTNGQWFEDFGHDCLEMPFEGVHLGLIECSAKNLSFNPFYLWLPLMRDGSGTMKLAILRNLHRLPPDEAHVLLEFGWKSQWRFVIKETHRIVEKHFPNYPHKDAMLAHGFDSVTHWPSRLNRR